MSERKLEEMARHDPVALYSLHASSSPTKPKKRLSSHHSSKHNNHASSSKSKSPAKFTTFHNSSSSSGKKNIPKPYLSSYKSKSPLKHSKSVSKLNRKSPAKSSPSKSRVIRTGGGGRPSTSAGLPGVDKRQKSGLSQSKSPQSNVSSFRFSSGPPQARSLSNNQANHPKAGKAKARLTPIQIQVDLPGELAGKHSHNHNHNQARHSQEKQREIEENFDLDEPEELDIKHNLDQGQLEQLQDNPDKPDDKANQSKSTNSPIYHPHHPNNPNNHHKILHDRNHNISHLKQRLLMAADEALMFCPATMGMYVFNIHTPNKPSLQTYSCHFVYLLIYICIL